MTEGVCPSGWHVPSDGEWPTMEILLGLPQKMSYVLLAALLGKQLALHCQDRVHCKDFSLNPNSPCQGVLRKEKRIEQCLRIDSTCPEISNELLSYKSTDIRPY